MEESKLPSKGRVTSLCAVALLLAGIIFFALPATAFSQAAREALKSIQSLSAAEQKTRLVEGAKKEGTLVFYGSLAIDASRPLLEAFKKSYPFLKIGHYRSGELGVYTKVSSEAKAGRNEVDVIENSPGASYGLIHDGLVDPYHSTEEPAVRREFIDPKGLWHAYSYLAKLRLKPTSKRSAQERQEPSPGRSWVVHLPQPPRFGGDHAQRCPSYQRPCDLGSRVCGSALS